MNISIEMRWILIIKELTSLAHLKAYNKVIPVQRFHIYLRVYAKMSMRSFNKLITV